MENEDLKGVYCIENRVTGEKYIGSAAVSFFVRLRNHRNCLNAGTHKNMNLQAAWDRYGEANFIFSILEVVSNDELILFCEQRWIDKFDFNSLYNINPLATGGLQFTEDVIRRRAITLKKTYQVRASRYNLWKSGELSDKDLSAVEIKQFKMWLEPPWNKGVKYESTDHLKVPKRVRGDRTNCKITMRSKLLCVEIYTVDGDLLMVFDSAKDIEEWSVTENNTLPIGGRFSKSRGQKAVKFLASGSINKACKTGKPYKNLIFKFKKKSPE